jgi:predicted DNA-binding transcriptional regulator YafY
MKLQEIFGRLRKIDAMIANRKTGGAANLARLLSVSERTIYKDIQDMKSLGAPIVYNHGRGSYEYTEPGYFKLGFEKIII